MREVQRQKDENRAQGQSHIQPGGQHVVILHPPSAPVTADVLVENESDDAPAQVIERRGGWDECRAAKEDGRADIANGAPWEDARENVDDDGEQESCYPKVHETGENLTGGEHAGRSNGAPYHRCIEENAAIGTGVSVGLMSFADIGDGGESPVHHADLHDGGPKTGYHLRSEGDARRDLHIVTWSTVQ